MGTPTAVLSEFWRELREKSRVKINHPDLPTELRDAAGALIAPLWERATATAHAALLAAQARLQELEPAFAAAEAAR